MAAPEYAQWFERGRAHQQAGRAIDAMLCYRRATRADPRASDPHFVLGEVLWQLGRLPEAIGAWREASRLVPVHLAPLQALAEALLATDDAAGARAAAARVQALAPDDARAALIGGIAAIAAGAAAADPAPAAAVAGVLQREPQLLAVATLAMPLARALDRWPGAAGRGALLDVIARTGAALEVAPLLLHALVLEHLAGAAQADAAEVRAATVALARARADDGGDPEGLRRIAIAVGRLDASIASLLAARYAAVCAASVAAPVPLSWPRRAAGTRLRVIVLLPAEPFAAAPLSELASLPGDAFEVALAAIGAAVPPAAAGFTGIALPAEPDAVAAKAIAARDPDVLVDLCGLAAAAGPLLAMRPARVVWTLATLPLPNRVPLVDRTIGSAAELAAALVALQHSRDPRSDCPLDAAALADAWRDAVRAHQDGDRAAALVGYRRFLETQPGYAPALYLSGMAQREDGDITGARDAFAAALAAAPGFVDARVAAARAALALHDPAAAIALCEQGLERARGDARLWRALGDAWLARHDGAAAAHAFETALGINPNDGEMHYNQGVALQMLRDSAGAARAYQRALALRPDLVAAHFNLGVLFGEQGATDAAIAAYGEVLAAEPGNVSAYKNLGETLLGAGRVDAWLANFRRFETHCPHALPLAVQALEACQHLADFPKLERYLDGLQQDRFAASGDVELVDCLEELLYLLLFFDVPAEMTGHWARTYDAAARRVYGAPLSRSATRRPGRLRIGYLSADLRNHVMGKMIWSAVRHHDKAQFELYFYALSSASDEWTEKFRGLADRFDVLGELDERAAAERIAADDLDLLVDLSTHTKGAKPGILALKPARVQVTHVASAGTVGLSTIDFKLTDAHADVPGNQASASEVLLPMEGCVYPYRHLAPAAEHPFHRTTLGIGESTIVIGAFVAGMKLSRRCLALWRDVLARIPRAQLAFSPVNPALAGMYERLAAAAGIARDRLLFLPQGRDDAENQARYTIVDFVLDPMPFGGVNGTLEALDMGVPVVTLLGKRHGERTSYSILANLGVTETIAASGRDYVEIAVRLADDPAFMREVRDRIRAGLAHSALTDMPAHTRALERAYLAALAARAPEALAGAARHGDV